MNMLLRAAIDYAKLGWHVFPCQQNGKKPLTPHGCKDATAQFNQLYDWWKKWPKANMGIACGPLNNLCVIDIDQGGLASLEKEGIKLEHTVACITSSGMLHFYYTHDKGVKNYVNFYESVDIRSAGGYVIAPPSVGKTGKEYTWIKGASPWECKLLEFPEDIKKEIQRRRNTYNTLLSDAIIKFNFSEDAIARAIAYITSCNPSIQGSGGHNALLYAATSLVHGFCLSDRTAYEILSRHFNPRCVPPWDLNDEKDYRDFVRKISEARKLSPRNKRGWLLNNDYSAVDGPELDVVSIINGQ